MAAQAYNEVMYNTYKACGKFQTGMTEAQIIGYLSIVLANTNLSNVSEAGAVY